jgi:hypothetical protein
MITWLNERPYVTCPDTICVVDAKTGEGLSVWGQEFGKNREVVVFGRRAYKIWRTKRGIELFSPKHFGFDIGYRPIEDIVGRLGKDRNPHCRIFFLYVENIPSFIVVGNRQD